MPRRTAAQPASARTLGGHARLMPDTDHPAAYLLTLDDTPQSYVDLDDPAHLEFEYVRRLAHPPGACSTARACAAPTSMHGCFA